MFFEVHKYSALYSKLKAMESQLFSKKEYEIFAQKKDIEALYYCIIGKKSYKDIFANLQNIKFNRVFLENQLIKSIYMDFHNIYKFIDDVNEKKYLKMFFLKYEIEAIKMLFRTIFSNIEAKNIKTNENLEFYKFLKFDINKILNCSTISELIIYLHNTEYGYILKKLDKENISLFDIELQLDLHYYNKIFKCQNMYLSKEVKKQQQQINGTNVDIYNLVLIYRAKKYYKIENTIIFTYLVPIQYKISKNEIKNILNSKNEKDFIYELSKTKYRNLANYFEDEDLEKCIFYESLKLQNKIRKNNPYSISYVTFYLFRKYVELKNLTILIECIRYNLDYKIAMKKIIVL